MQIHVDRAAFVEAATKSASFADDPMPVVRIDAADRLTFTATNNERFCRLITDANIRKGGAVVVDALGSRAASLVFAAVLAGLVTPLYATLTTVRRPTVAPRPVATTRSITPQSSASRALKCPMRTW